MMRDILMPSLSPTMESGVIAKWLVKVGDSFRSGDILAEVETDKATMEIEAFEDGVIAELLAEENGNEVQVKAPIARFVSQNSEPGTGSAIASPPPKPPHQSDHVSADTQILIAEHNDEPEEVGYTGEHEVEGPLQTVRDALRDAIAEEMRRDDSVFILGEEVGEYQGAYKVTQGLLEEFGKRRVVDTPITEHGFAGIGVGAAFAGLRPIVEFMTFNFSLQAIDHIVNSAAKTLYMSGGQLRAPIVFRGPNGAAARVGAQHSQDFSAWYSHIPGLKVIAPYTASDAKGLLKSAIRDESPVVFLENEILYGHRFSVPEDENRLVPIGKSRIVRKGSDVTLISWSMGLWRIEQAFPQLKALEFDPAIIDLRTLRPLDLAPVYDSIRTTGRCVIVEDGWPQCGVSAEISSQIMQHAFDHLDAPVLRITGKDLPMPYAANLESMALPTSAEIVDAVRQVCYR